MTHSMSQGATSTGRLLLAILVLVSAQPCVADWPPVSRDTAMERAWAHLGLAPAAVVRCTLEGDWFPCPCPSWYVDMETDEGTASAYIDAVTGRVWGWTLHPTSHVQMAGDPEPVPSVALAEAEKTALSVAARAHPAIAEGAWPMALGSPVVGQFTYIFAWDPVADSQSGALGPVEVVVEVDHRTGEAVAFTDATVYSWSISLRPTISRSAMLTRARRYALLDPYRFPINRVTLRAAVDTRGSQRLVWECLQVLDGNVETGVTMYGVVHDAHTGEPLYPITPFGGGKHQMRPIRFPKRASVQVEPGRRALSTQLSPPVLGRDGLWLRAEHLRAVEGVRVDVARDRVTVHVGGKTLNQADLGAQWRAYGWWVPLRHVAKLLGWQVDWNNAKKEATILTGG